MSGNGGVSARESDAAGPSARASSGSEPLGLVRLMSQRSPQNTAGQRSKQARVADWSTAFLTVDKTRGGAGNKYYWCNELRENLHLSTLWSVHAESVKEQRRQQREAMAELVRERASDPEWMPPEGGMLDLLFSGDPEAAAVIDHGDGGIARLLQAALARAQAAREAAGETAAAPTAQGADAPTATTTTTAAELAERPAAAGPPPPTEDLQALRLLQLRHTDQAWQRGRATDELEI